MVLRGQVKNGVIVLEPGVTLPEGAVVQVEADIDTEAVTGQTESLEHLRVGLLHYAGRARGGPSDLARNHDHYLHGTPRK